MLLCMVCGCQVFFLLLRFFRSRSMHQAGPFKKSVCFFIEIIEEEYHSSPPPSSPPPSDPPSSKPPSNPPSNPPSKPPASKPAKLSMDALPSAESCPPSPCPPPSYPTNIQPNRLFSRIHRKFGQKQSITQHRRQSTSVSEIDCRPAVIRGMFNDPMP